MSRLKEWYVKIVYFENADGDYGIAEIQCHRKSVVIPAEIVESGNIRGTDIQHLFDVNGIKARAYACEVICGFNRRLDILRVAVEMLEESSPPEDVAE